MYNRLLVYLLYTLLGTVKLIIQIEEKIARQQTKNKKQKNGKFTINNGNRFDHSNIRCTGGFFNLPGCSCEKVKTNC